MGSERFLKVCHDLWQSGAKRCTLNVKKGGIRNSNEIPLGELGSRLIVTPRVVDGLRFEAGKWCVPNARWTRLIPVPLAAVHACVSVSRYGWSH